MRDVVTNTSPLLYLHQLRLLELLPRLYGRVVVPTAVAEELAEGGRRGHDVPTPSALEWIDLVPAPAAAILALVTDLGEGERAAIALAMSRKSDLLLIDDGLARRHAKLVGLTFTGTLGILLRAKEQRHIGALAPLIERLTELGFRLAPETRAAVLKLANE